MPEAALLPSHLVELRERAHRVATTTLAAHADEVDEQGRWPVESLAALADAGLMGLHVDPSLGGSGEGLLALALVTEQLGRACGSTSLIYGMHCVGSKVIGVKATAEQQQRYLRPIAAGEHLTSLALSEPGTGVHFYLPRVTFRRGDGLFTVDGRKAFVTSGGHADSYVTSVVSGDSDMDPGTFSCLLVDEGSPGLSWEDAWDGMGMRGNSSRAMVIDGTPVPAANLLGAEGDETWYVFEVIAPFFIVAMAGTYLGIASAALDHTVDHLRKRTYVHTGERAGSADTVTHRLGSLWSTVERTRHLLYHAARLGDAGHPEAREALFACKAEVADATVAVVNEAMTLTGGLGYARNGLLARALRDARAAHVMTPTTDLLKTWLGRSLLDLPLL